MPGFVLIIISLTIPDTAIKADIGIKARLTIKVKFSSHVVWLDIIFIVFRSSFQFISIGIVPGTIFLNRETILGIKHLGNFHRWRVLLFRSRGNTTGI